MTATLSNRAARRIFLDRHALLEQPTGSAEGADLLALITRLGFVQVDSINTLARAHDLILFARRPRYRPENLRRLYDRGGALFEHWTHDASIIPAAFFPWWRWRMARERQDLLGKWRKWRRDGFEERMADVLAHIRAHGPCASSDLGQDEPKAAGGWWDWHPSKTALEYLWRAGTLSVCRRDGFRKVYDLTERVIDPALLAAEPDEETTRAWCCNAALDRLGFGTPGEIARFWDHFTPAEVTEWARCETAASRLLEITVAGADGTPHRVLARPGILDDPAGASDPPGRVRALSPFDPALRDRARARRLFGFDYTIEVFVPAARRRYGYYVFPLLEDDRIIGRVDMKAMRDRDTLAVRALWPEPGIRWGKSRHTRFEAELDRLTRLAGVRGASFGPGWLHSD